ncbi:putative dual specificity phosphatase domain protein [Paratrimastix pyriformis]|uniref:Dual specificity phosphatase domain protein n=1 Tax=Paratrimastix pyriformis TaxID=342808 RepID=A0ABQ8UL23_9EUKA|nr:putative dual specificity phosphatase domain protein [Paratrimastix pyriformis]
MPSILDSPAPEIPILPISKVRDGLFIGDRFSVADKLFLANNKITHIINCAGVNVPNRWAKMGIKYLTFSLQDEDNSIFLDPDDVNVTAVHNFTEDAAARMEGVIIHSYYGRSRALLVAAAHFMRKYGWAAELAIDVVHATRRLKMRDSFQAQLREYQARTSLTDLLPALSPPIVSTQRRAPVNPGQAALEEATLLHNTVYRRHLGLGPTPVPAWHTATPHKCPAHVHNHRRSATIIVAAAQQQQQQTSSAPAAASALSRPLPIPAALAPSSVGSAPSWALAPRPSPPPASSSPGVRGAEAGAGEDEQPWLGDDGAPVEDDELAAAQSPPLTAAQMRARLAPALSPTSLSSMLARRPPTPPHHTPPPTPGSHTSDVPQPQPQPQPQTQTQPQTQAPATGRLPSSPATTTAIRQPVALMGGLPPGRASVSPASALGAVTEELLVATVATPPAAATRHHHLRAPPLASPSPAPSPPNATATATATASSAASIANQTAPTTAGSALRDALAALDAVGMGIGDATGGSPDGGITLADLPQRHQPPFAAAASSGAPLFVSRPTVVAAPPRPWQVSSREEDEASGSEEGSEEDDRPKCTSVSTAASSQLLHRNGAGGAASTSHGGTGNAPPGGSTSSFWAAFENGGLPPTHRSPPASTLAGQILPTPPSPRAAPGPHLSPPAADHSPGHSPRGHPRPGHAPSAPRLGPGNAATIEHPAGRSEWQIGGEGAPGEPLPAAQQQRAAPAAEPVAVSVAVSLCLSNPGRGTKKHARKGPKHSSRSPQRSVTLASSSSGGPAASPSPAPASARAASGPSAQKSAGPSGSGAQAAGPATPRRVGTPRGSSSSAPGRVGTPRTLFTGSPAGPGLGSASPLPFDPLQHPPGVVQQPEQPQAMQPPSNPQPQAAPQPGVLQGPQAGRPGSSGGGSGAGGVAGAAPQYTFSAFRATFSPKVRQAMIRTPPSPPISAAAPGLFHGRSPLSLVSNGPPSPQLDEWTVGQAAGSEPPGGPGAATPRGAPPPPGGGQTPRAPLTAGGQAASAHAAHAAHTGHHPHSFALPIHEAPLASTELAGPSHPLGAGGRAPLSARLPSRGGGRSSSVPAPNSARGVSSMVQMQWDLGPHPDLTTAPSTDAHQHQLLLQQFQQQQLLQLQLQQQQQQASAPAQVSQHAWRPPTRGQANNSLRASASRVAGGGGGNLTATTPTRGIVEQATLAGGGALGALAASMFGHRRDSPLLRSSISFAQSPASPLGVSPGGQLGWSMGATTRLGSPATPRTGTPRTGARLR